MGHRPAAKDRAARTGRRRMPVAGVALGAAAVLVAAAACGSSGGGGASKQVGASAKQTIVFATQGLGGEGAASKAAVQAFQKLHPNITVQIQTLSPTGDVALQQLQQRFIAQTSTPDVITSDVIWPSTFARSKWIANLDRFHPNTSAFFPGQMASGKYNGHVYGIPWFINAEGIYYRTDLVKTPPTTPQELLAAAKAAMAKDKSLKEGLAFEGDKYEGSVTALQSFGGNLDPANLNAPATQQALAFMRSAITSGVAPSAVTTWQEPNVESAWTSGQTAFALNWPYVLQESQTKAAVKGKTGWIPFPSATPQASLGGDDLVINANSTHQAAAYEFIKYLTSPQAQTARAIAAGDPPAIQSAYNDQLFAKAPYFKQEVAVFKAATPRPVTPVYPQISTQLQTMISSVLSGSATASDALSATAPTVKALAQTVTSG